MSRYIVTTLQNLLNTGFTWANYTSVRWVSQVGAGTLAQTPFNRKLAAVRAWRAWAEERGKSRRHSSGIEASPAQNIKGIELGRRKARWLNRRETYALLRELQKADQLAAVRAGGDPGHPALVQAKRDAAVVALLLHAGLRGGWPGLMGRGR